MANEHRGLEMKNTLVICMAVGVGIWSSIAFARGGMGGGMGGMGMSHIMGSARSVGAGGSFGEGIYSPGTNSLGTALPSSGSGRPMKGPLLGTSPAIDREEARVEKALGSICRGC
jgi:hypothetical protein